MKPDGQDLHWYLKRIQHFEEFMHRVHLLGLVGYYKFMLPYISLFIDLILKEILNSSQIRLSIVYLCNILDLKMQLNLLLCVQKSNKNPWYSIQTFFVAYDANIQFALLFSYTTQAIDVYKFINGVAPNLVYLILNQSWVFVLLISYSQYFYTIRTFLSFYNNNGVTLG